MTQISKEAWKDVTNRARVKVVVDMLRQLYPGDRYEEVQKMRAFCHAWLDELDAKHEISDAVKRSDETTTPPPNT